MDSTTPVIESQVDWLTCAVHSDAKQVDLEHLAAGWATGEVLDRHKMKPFRLMGYEGWRVGRVRYGTRDTGGLVQLSGALAERHLTQLAALADNISRVDCAVTVRLAVLDDHIALDHYNQAIHHRADHPQAAVPWLIQNGRNGATCYIGDRSSDWFLRIYNKQREAEQADDAQGILHYAACWRYELEVKGQCAAQVAKSLAASADRATDVQSAVHDYSTGHGLLPLFARSGGTRLAAGFRRRSDYDTRLRWLRRSVEPAVRWMVANGGRDEVLHALDLDT